MSADASLEFALPRILQDLGEGAEPDYVDDLLARTEQLPQRHVFGVGARSHIPWQLIAAAALLALAAAAAALAVGNRRTEMAPLTGPAGNGQIAYFDWKGDLFLGNPRDGSSTLLVDNAEIGSDPVFSPDGSRIAFIGGTIRAPEIFVVRADGSDLQAIGPVSDEGRRDGPLPLSGLSWTADGASIIRTTYESEFVLFDADGRGGRRDISSAEADALEAGAVRYPAVSPADGAQLLYDDTGTIAVTAADGTTTVLVDPTVAGAPKNAGPPTWSPDGSIVMFEAAVPDGGGRIFVVNPDGTGLRQLSQETSLPGGDGDQNPKWSPDGSMIAAARYFQSSVPPSTGRQTDFPDSEIVVFDVATGEEHPFEGTRLEQGLTSWTWSPDGRSLLVLGFPNSPLKLVDATSGVITELPWATRSAPSWQRVAVH